MVRRLEDAGAAAIIDALALRGADHRRAARRPCTTSTTHADAHAEALVHISRGTDDTRSAPTSTSSRFRRIKAAVDVPVIASLNGTTGRGWIDYAAAHRAGRRRRARTERLHVATDLREDRRAHRAARARRRAGLCESAVTIPVAVKLSPFFSSLAHLAARSTRPAPTASCSSIASISPTSTSSSSKSCRSCTLSDSVGAAAAPALAGDSVGPRARVARRAAAACTRPIDAIKAIMAGADAVQMVSALLQHGPSDSW